MQRIRETLIGSSIALALTTAGVAFGHGADKVSETRPGQATGEAHVDVKVTAHAPSSPRVKVIQQALHDRGLYQGKIDGIPGPQTEAALREFQNRNGLTPTGELNVSTANALGINGEKQMVAGTDAPASAKPVMQPGPQVASENVQLSTLSAEQAKEMQERLQLLGYYRGEIDGVLGAGTRAALQRYFRAQSDLAAQGVISNSAISMFGTEVQEVPAP